MDFNPIPITDFFTKSLANPFVKWSAKFCCDRTNSIDITPFMINSLIILCLIPKCLDFPLYIWLYALASVALLSQRIEIGDIGLGHIGISYTKFLSHSASLPAAANATNSDSIVELVIHVCFLEAHEMAPPPSKNTHPLVEDESSTLFIQLASE